MTNPLIQEFEELRKERGCTYLWLTEKSGLGYSTIWTWSRAGRVPNLENFQAALNAFGYELKIVKTVGGG